MARLINVAGAFATGSPRGSKDGVLALVVATMTNTISFGSCAHERDACESPAEEHRRAYAASAPYPQHRRGVAYPIVQTIMMHKSVHAPCNDIIDKPSSRMLKKILPFSIYVL